MRVPVGVTLEPVIALEAVSRRFGELIAVDRIDLAVERGEFFSLLGPSGCGKTTTLRLIAGFDPLESGRIRLEGQDVSRLPPHRRPVNTVFQNYALFPHLSVWENVAFGPRARGLAAAPMSSPAALLLDEPLAALDPFLRRSVRTELRRIQRELGLTVLMVSHDQEEVLALSDRLAVMRAGRIEQQGTPRQLYDAPANPFVGEFLGRANLLLRLWALLAYGLLFAPIAVIVLFSFNAPRSLFCLSYAALTLKARLSGFDWTLEEAAQDLGRHRCALSCGSRCPCWPPACGNQRLRRAGSPRSEGRAAAAGRRGCQRCRGTPAAPDPAP